MNFHTLNKTADTQKAMNDIRSKENLSIDEMILLKATLYSGKMGDPENIGSSIGVILNSGLLKAKEEMTTDELEIAESLNALNNIARAQMKQISQRYKDIVSGALIGKPLVGKEAITNLSLAFHTNGYNTLRQKEVTQAYNARNNYLAYKKDQKIQKEAAHSMGGFFKGLASFANGVNSKVSNIFRSKSEKKSKIGKFFSKVGNKIANMFPQRTVADARTDFLRSTRYATVALGVTLIGIQNINAEEKAPENKGAAGVGYLYDIKAEKTAEVSTYKATSADFAKKPELSKWEKVSNIAMTAPKTQAKPTNLYELMKARRSRGA